MIKFECTDTWGWMAAIRGMRNPLNSWVFSKTAYKPYEGKIRIDMDKDYKLMKSLSSAGPSHSKFRRMIMVWVDITAPLYWWKEFDTYKVGTVANSCSTMHKIHSRDLTIEDFSTDHMNENSKHLLMLTIQHINQSRANLNVSKDKEDWWQMIQSLPTSYNQKRTVMLNYEVLANMFETRQNHKLDEWNGFCEWIKELPYAGLITGNDEDNHLKGPKAFVNLSSNIIYIYPNKPENSD